MQTSTLFSVLPEYICTPDGMEIDREGNLVLSCPNYADDKDVYKRQVFIMTLKRPAIFLNEKRIDIRDKI